MLTKLSSKREKPEVATFRSHHARLRQISGDGIIQSSFPGNRKRGRPKTARMDSVTLQMGMKLEDEIQKWNRSEWRTTIHSEA